MAAMILKNLIQRIPEIECTGNMDIPVQGIAYNSRSARKGDLFVAVKGEKTDGALYIADAAANGKLCGRAATASAQQMPKTNSKV